MNKEHCIEFLFSQNYVVNFVKSENYLYSLKFNLAMCKIYCPKKFIIKYAWRSEHAAVSQFLFFRMTLYNALRNTAIPFSNEVN